MRLGYITNGLTNHRLDDALDLIADLGYRAVGLTLDTMHLDPRDTDAARLHTLAERLQRLELAPAIETGARFLLDPRRKHEPTLISPTADARARRQRFYERALDIAAALGAPLISLWSGVRHPDIPADRAWSWLVEGVRATCAAADARGLRVAFEPEPGMLVETMAEYRRLAAAVDHPTLGLTVDLGHLQCVETPPLARHLTDAADALIHVHVDDIAGHEHLHLPIGAGEIAFPPLFEALRAIDYQGLALVELSRDAHRAPTVAADAIRRLGPLLA